MQKATKKKAPAKKAQTKNSKNPANTANGNKSNVSYMWAYLKEKEEARKLAEKENKHSYNTFGKHSMVSNQKGFTRFHGPRRKAA